METKELAKAMKRWREAHSLGCDEASRKVRVSGLSWYNWETGRAVPKPEVKHAIETLLATGLPPVPEGFAPDRIRQLADHIEDQDDIAYEIEAELVDPEEHHLVGYTQTEWTHGCGTPACIAGHAVALALTLEHIPGGPSGEEPQVGCPAAELYVGEYTSDLEIGVTAGEWMGLDGRMSEQLFEPHPLPGDKHPTPRHAAWVLRNLADTGLVEWNDYPG